MSKNIWVTSDSHFRHSNILKFTDSATGKLIRGNRFADVDEMDEHMIERWNSVVKQGDIVYHLGDVVIAKNQEDKEWFKKNWPRLNGSKRLIVGNHDDIPFLASGGFFKKVQMWRMFPEFGLMLSHVPLHESGLRRGAPNDPDAPVLVNIHGHIHQNPGPAGPYRNVSVEVTDYTPVNMEELRVL
jgi:calcineurin-like phosphoesterase family protein